MHFRLDHHSGVPVYLQLVEQVKTAVATGLLRDGDAIPSVRALAEELRVNRNTVARAWGELEREGVLHVQQGLGCFITTSATPLKRAVRTERLAEAVDALLVQAHHLQVDEAALRALFEERLRRFREASQQREDGT